MAAAHIPHLTPEEYLAIDRAAEFRSEYFEGRMFAMSGGTYAHFRLIANLTGELYQLLRGSDCTVGSSELRVRTSPEGLYTYPDIVAICGPPRFGDDQRDTLLNPTLIVEVLSKSTEAMDRGLKFRQYRKIDSLREYALVSQTAPVIEVFMRGEEGDWRMREHAGVDAWCDFTSIGCRVALADVYGVVDPTLDETPDRTAKSP